MKIPIEVGLGAGIGTIQVLLTKYYDRPLIPQIPQPWGNLSTLGNIIAGGVTLGLSFTGKLDRYPKVKDFLIPYGFSALFGGILSGAMAYIPQAGFRQAGFQPSYNHRAKGFGAQYAVPGTSIPYNTVVF